MKKKNTKWDLVWIIPEIISSLAICVSGIYHIFNVSTTLILEQFIWDVSLVMLVMGMGIKFFSRGMDELREALHKQ